MRGARETAMVADKGAVWVRVDGDTFAFSQSINRRPSLRYKLLAQAFEDLPQEIKETMLVLGRDWHSSYEELIEAARELAK